MNRRTIAALCATPAIAGFAVLANPASAWDELPCGPTEATAHVCAPGEVARDGTIPNPLPTPAPTPQPPEIVPTGAQGVTVPPSVAPPPPVARRTCRELLNLRPRVGRRTLILRGCVKANPPEAPPKTCGQLIARGAGRLSLVARGCDDLNRRQSPTPPVAGAITLLDRANGWAYGIVMAAGDDWRNSRGVDNGTSAWYRYIGRQAGRRIPNPVRGHVLNCTDPSRPTMVCTTTFAAGSLNVSLFYSAGAGGSFVAKATLTRTAR